MFRLLRQWITCLYALSALTLQADSRQPSVRFTSAIAHHEVDSYKEYDQRRLLPKRIFSAQSFWYQPIPQNAPLHPNSADFVAEFIRLLRTYYGSVDINTNAYSGPIFVVGPDVRRARVLQWRCQGSGSIDQALERQWQAVPIPDYAQAADGTDAEMSIYQPSSDTLWEFWRARKVNNQWEACWGGRLGNVSESDGIWPTHYGATATGLPLIGGQLRADELRSGAINHVIGISLPEAESWRKFSWPANRSDGYNPQNLPHRIPEGLRFRLDPSVDVDALQLHPVAKMIAKAAQIYGFIVWDRAGAISLRAESPKRFTLIGIGNPYPSLWGGTPSYSILKRFPWDKLQFMPMDYGRPH